MEEAKVTRPSGSVPVPRMRRGFKTFINEVIREMKRVTWPSRPETNRLTGVVLVICGLLVVVLFLMGLLVGSALDLLMQNTR